LSWMAAGRLAIQSKSIQIITEAMRRRTAEIMATLHNTSPFLGEDAETITAQMILGEPEAGDEGLTIEERLDRGDDPARPAIHPTKFATLFNPAKGPRQKGEINA
jgi:hypothetical protein